MFDPALLEERLAKRSQEDHLLLFGDPHQDDPLRRFPQMRPYHQYTKRRRALAGHQSGPLQDWLFSGQPLHPLRKVYIHFPFCRSRCLYCGFFMGFNRPDKVQQYLDCLIAEIKRKGQTPWVQGRPFSCVYLGGGTPSDLEPDDLKRLLDAVHENLPLANDAEITLEGRLKGFDEARQEAALSRGVNRFSFGVQSFDTLVRKQVGRKLNREEVKTRLKELVADGRALVIVDLIYGLPDQDLAVWQRDIDDLFDCGVHGVSGYMLRTAVNNPLEKAVRAGLLTPEADLVQRGRMYQALRERLLAAGWKRLNMTHWGADSRERCVYDSQSFADTDMVAFGCAAHGQINGFGMINLPMLEGYLKLVRRGRYPVMFCTQSPPEYRAYFDIADQTGMRMFSFERFARKYGLDLKPVLEPVCERWVEMGLLQHQDGYYALTAAGEFWQPNLSQTLMDCLDLASPEFDDRVIDLRTMRIRRYRFNPDWYREQLRYSPEVPGLADRLPQFPPRHGDK